MAGILERENGDDIMARTAARIFLGTLTLVLVVGCATMQDRWEAAESADTIAAYEDFLKKYPEGDLADKARARRTELYKQRAKKQALPLPETYQGDAFLSDAVSTLEKLYYEQAVQSDTVPGYEDFLQRYPSGGLAEDARRRMGKLFADEARARDTIPAYERYLNRYPAGPFAEEARARSEELRVASLAWGEIMYPKPKTNIRAKRSSASPLKGQLRADQPVKADFLQDGWYAVFPATEKERDEKKAMGYVYAPLLAAHDGSGSIGSADRRKESAKGAREKGNEEMPASVNVKNIAFRITADEKELLFIGFDSYYVPAVCAIRGEAPMLMLEVKNASPLSKDWALIDTKGKFIKRIRSRMDSKAHAALIVLDMEPSKNYLVNQKFYGKDNAYVLEISEEKEPSPPEVFSTDSLK